MDTRGVLETAGNHLSNLVGHTLDVVSIGAPASPAAAVNLSRVISKLSAILGNLIEFHVVDFLNQQAEYNGLGKWRRQDPGFPDTVFDGAVTPTPGFEIKAWFPLSTEITARFKDSQRHFAQNQTNVVFVAWLPEHLIFGKPVIQDLCIVSGASVAKSRDDHYHQPPDYLVVEPNDTSGRTSNLQQTNTNGYKWQGDINEQFAEAVRLVASWGEGGQVYSPDGTCQTRVRELMGRYPYRLDTNFAKTDRIKHPEIEAFKSRVLNASIHGRSVASWAKLLNGTDETRIDAYLRRCLPLGWK